MRSSKRTRSSKSTLQGIDDRPQRVNSAGAQAQEDVSGCGLSIAFSWLFCGFSVAFFHGLFAGSRPSGWATLLQKHLTRLNLTSRDFFFWVKLKLGSVKRVQDGDFQGGFEIQHRAALKLTNLRGQTPICGFLRVPVLFCGFLQKSAVFCKNLCFPNALISRKRRESAKISENLQKSAFGLGSSP